MEPQKAYEELIYRARERALLGSCSAILGWDEQTYLPVGGADHRGAQMALLAGLQHEKATDPRVGDLLTIVEGSGLLLADTVGAAAVNVRELRRTYNRQVRLPRALVEELARTTSLAHPQWVAARSASDFGTFRPWLEKIIQLKREEAACLAAAMSAYSADLPGGQTPSDATVDRSAASDALYDPLLDEYEPGAKSS